MKHLALFIFVLLCGFKISAQTYKTITVGNQTWMAENLDRVIAGSWVYNESQNLGKTYGRLYTWEAAQKACPAGWQLPSDRDWQTLIDATGGEDKAAKQLKVGGACGFNALLGGMSSVGGFSLLNTYGTFWTSSEYDKDHAWYVYITSSANTVTKTYFKKNYAFSVRCIKSKK
jgi:uncharacterized protein (TIGR02145 family)